MRMSASPASTRPSRKCVGGDVINEDPETGKLARDSENSMQFVVLVAASR